MPTLALFGYYISSTVLLLAAIVAAGFGLSRLETKLRERRAQKADRPSQNTMQVQCGACGDAFPVEYHTHQMKQGHAVVGMVVHASKTDVELHILTCKGHG